MLSIIDFCNKNEIKWFPNNINKKKEPIIPVKHQSYNNCSNNIPVMTDFKDLTNEEIKIFVEQNKHIIKQLVALLDGVLLYAIKNLNAYKEELGDFVTNNISVEKQEIGKTFVNFFDNPTFNCHYYASLPRFDDLTYFDYYFDRPIYSGKTLINFIASPHCFIFPLLKMILDIKFTPEQLNSISKELDATLI